MEYAEFIKQKEFAIMPTGISDIDLMPKNEICLKDFQRDIVEWALKLGNAAIFADCGMGKTPMQLYWADNIARHTDRPVLILCPLAVANQTIREGVKFGIMVHSAYSATKDPIQITNYEKLEHFEKEIQSGYYSGLVLDESSILKNFSGKIRQYIQDISRKIPYKLCCSATPCPNDFMEIGTHAEFLGYKKRVEMLAEFFVHDSGDTQKWRIKGHAEEPFWKWMASWSVAIRKPSDLGFDDTEFILPELLVKNQVVKSEKSSGMLFFKPAETLLERQQARKNSTLDRCKVAADIANESNDTVLIWCDRNCESETLAKLISNSVEVRGSDSREDKELAILWFKDELNNYILTNHADSDKLAICGKRNTQKTDSLNTQQTKTSETSESNNPVLQKKISDICKIGTNKIKNTCENIGSGLLKNEMQGGVNCTLLMNHAESNSESKVCCGENKTQLNTLPKESKNTELLQSSTIPSLNPSVEDVQYVENNKNDSTLTTAIQQTPSEDCYAQSVILESESLKTIQNFLRRHRLTSSNANNRKVLISKPSIFGAGLNLQHCHKMIFVGLSDSFEQYYQAVRRCWRFGQKKDVEVIIITSEAEGNILDNIKNKQMNNDSMFMSLVQHMSIYGLAKEKRRITYYPSQNVIIPEFLKRK